MRLRTPLALAALLSTALPGAALADVLEGQVRRDGHVVELVLDGRAYVVTPVEQARELKRLAGRAVRLEGRLTTDPRGEALVEVRRLVSPQRRAFEGIPDGDGLRLGDPLHTASQPRVVLTGPARSAVLAAGAALVQGEGYVFTHPDGRPFEVQAEWVRAVASRPHTLRNAPVAIPIGLLGGGSVSAGEALQVRRVRDGYALVRGASGDEGWLPLDELRLGQPLASAAGLIRGLRGLGD